jgi:hypothetical protein
MKEVHFFKRTNGSSPREEFLDELTDKKSLGY